VSLRNVELQTVALHVGSPNYALVNTGTNIPLPKAGVLTNPGISIFGDAIAGEKATVTIYPPHKDSKQSSIFSLYVNGDSAFIGDVAVNGNQSITKDLRVSGTTYASVQGTINVQGWKGFDIKHPTKENHRLRYVCLEGPEGGVYHRGILKDSEIIELPDYWKDLVDAKTITVHLTPIGTYQYLYYTVAKNRIIVKNHSNLPTHCSYIVYGERKDGERLIPEYKGDSPQDYPGKNDQYSIAGYHYDRRTL
jgi:hypothetical protein